MPNVRMPDGIVVRFPDDMPPEQIKGMIASKFPDLTKPQEPEAPRNYRAAEVPLAAINRVIPNTAEVVGNIAEHYGQEQPDQTGTSLEQAQPTDVVSRIAGDVAKTGIGIGEKLVGGVAGALGYGPEIGSPEYVGNRYEREYADPMLQNQLKFWGWREPTWQAQKETIKRNVAEKPVQAGLDVSMFAAPAPLRGVQTLSRAVNPLSWAGRGVTTVAKRAVTPFPARAANREARAVLEGEGIPQTAGQVVGHEGLKYAETIGGRRTQALIDRQNEAFTAAGARRIGENTNHLDEGTMNAAYDRIGGTFGDVAQRNTLTATPHLERAAQNVVRTYASRTPPHSRVPLIEQTYNTILSIRRGPMRGRMAGDAYQNLRSELGKAARSATGETQHALYGLQRALDDAMERGLSGADRVALRNARRQYRNWLVLERAMGPGSGVAGAAGILTPTRLQAGLAQIAGRRGYVLGRHDFGNLDKAGRIGMTPLPQSGTIPRGLARGVPAAIGAALTGATGMLLPVAAGLGTTLAAGRAITSPLIQRYLANQVLPIQGLTRAGRVLGAGGRIATGIAANVAAEKRRKKEQQKGPR